MSEERNLANEVVTRVKNEIEGKKVNLPDGAEGRIIEAIGTSLISNLVWAAKESAKASADGNGSISFCNLIDVNVTKRDAGDEDAEKDGNLMVSFVPGPQAKLIVKDDAVTESDDDEE